MTEQPFDVNTVLTDKNLSNLYLGEDGNIHFEVGDTLHLLEVLRYIASLESEKSSLIVLPGLYDSCIEEITSLRERIEELENQIAEDSFSISIQDSNGDEISLIEEPLSSQLVNSAVKEWIEKALTRELELHSSSATDSLDGKPSL
jgi:hypothetical protein